MTHPRDDDWRQHLSAESLSTDATETIRQAEIDSPEAEVRPSLPVLDIGDGIERELRVLGEIGRGGMGAVHLVRQRSLERDVAAKRLPPDRAERSLAQEALLAEARIQGQLEHPNIVPVHSLGLDSSGQPVLVMKRLTAVPWQALLRDRDHPGWPPGVDDPFVFHLQTLMQVCHAVHFAHNRGIVHRDIKPANVMVGAFGEVYLIDWGLGFHLNGDTPVSPLVVGTPAYLAPEMARGTGPHIGPHTDIYQLGAVLHEILTGTRRHRGANVVETMLSAVESAPVYYPPGVPEELAALCNRATHPDPHARPSSALAFRGVIAAYLEHRGSIAIATAAIERLARMRALADDERGTLSSASDRAMRVLFNEASFGFQQALSVWPKNEPARARLDEARELMFRHEIAHRNHEAAVALLDQMSGDRPDLQAMATWLGEDLAREQKELAKLRRVAEDSDPSVSIHNRAAAFSGVGVLISGAMLALWQYPGGSPPNVVVALAAGSAALFVLGIVWAFRARVLTTKKNESLWRTVIAALVAFALHHLAGDLLRIPAERLVPGDILFAAAFFSVIGWTFHPRVAYFPLPIAVAAFVAARFPAYAFPIAAGSWVLATVLVVTVARRMILRQAHTDRSDKPAE